MSPEEVAALAARVDGALSGARPDMGRTARNNVSWAGVVKPLIAAWHQERERADRAEAERDALRARLVKAREGLEKFCTSPDDDDSEVGWAALREALEDAP